MVVFFVRQILDTLNAKGTGPLRFKTSTTEYTETPSAVKSRYGRGIARSALRGYYPRGLATGVTARPTRTSRVQISLRARYRPSRYFADTTQRDFDARA